MGITPENPGQSATPSYGGTLVQLGELEGAQILPRQVAVWCPPGYAEQPERRFPVLYMHDGQNIFDPAGAFGGQSWEVHAAMARLIERGTVPATIVVGVWNSAQRWRDYMPARPYHAIVTPEQRQEFVTQAGGEPLSDLYLRFLVESVKPRIDAAFRTKPERDNTTVMGSSMGGLISLYALEEYPAVFGAAGCVSTHWPIGGAPLVAAMGAALPPAGVHRLYFDYGTAGLDAAYEPLQLQMNGLLRAAGYVEGIDLLTRKFDGADHNEAAWRARVELPLSFLLQRAPDGSVP